MNPTRLHYASRLGDNVRVLRGIDDEGGDEDRAETEDGEALLEAGRRGSH